MHSVALLRDQSQGGASESQLPVSDTGTLTLNIKGPEAEATGTNLSKELANEAGLRERPATMMFR